MIPQTTLVVAARTYDTVASILIYFLGVERQRGPEQYTEGSGLGRVHLPCSLGSPEFFLNFTCKSVHFGAFWRRLYNFGGEDISRRNTFWGKGGGGQSPP